MGNDMFNDEQLADAEVRAQASGFILSREAFLRRLHVLADTVANNDSLLPSEVDLSAHDAALRAEVERLKDAIEIEREGQRSMARAMNEINRLSRLDVAINLTAPAEVERLRKALGYITDISEANADRAIVEMKRIAHEALDSAPAEEEGRDA